MAIGDKMHRRGEGKMQQISKGIAKPTASFAMAAILMAGAAGTTVQAKEWQALAGAESPDRGSQALAFLPNEFWIHTGDTIQWTFSTHERHTLTFLTAGQTRPPNFGPVFGVGVGCPGATPDGSSFDGSACVNSDILLLPEDSDSTATSLSYSVTFPSAGNFKFVCLVHADMTGLVHVLTASAALPHDQDFYDRQAQREQAMLLAESSRLEGRGTPGQEDRTQSSAVAAGIGEVVTTTGAGSHTAALMRFVPDTIIVHVGDIVEWTSLDPSINHTVTFGTEPDDPRVASTSVQPASDGPRQASITTPADSLNSGFLSPAPQDRANLTQAAPGVTRFRVTFKSAGTFNYICAVHDQLGMKGTVIVQP
jgi:plastocyanin